MSEAELSEQCQKKNKYAQNQLYKQYAGILFALCIRYIGHNETTKDLLHDGFLKIYTSFDQFSYRGKGSLKAWLCKVMVNTILEYLRKNEKTKNFILMDEIPESQDIPEESPSLTLIPQEVIMKFIIELPIGYRTVFNLYTFEEKSHKEIAELLGINEKSSSSQLYRAKIFLSKKIKEYLNKYEYEKG